MFVLASDLNSSFTHHMCPNASLLEAVYCYNVFIAAQTYSKLIKLRKINQNVARQTPDIAVRGIRASTIRREFVRLATLFVCTF